MICTQIEFRVYLSYNSDTKLLGCLSALHDHRGLFEKEKIEREPDLDRRVSRLSGIDIEEVKIALKVLGREDPRELPLEEYVTRVNQFMSIRCPDMLEQYGQ